MTYIPAGPADPVDEQAPCVQVLAETPAVRVLDYRCSAQGATRAGYGRDTLVAVRRGSFCYADHGYTRLLTPGAVVLGRAGEEYACSHEYGCGDHCTVFEFAQLEPRARAAAFVPAPRLAALLALSPVEAAYGLVLSGGFVELPPSLRRPDRDRAQHAAALIEARYAEPLGLEELAAAVAVSPFHFLRLFKQELGVTPHQYLLRTRLRHALVLLQHGQPVTEVALAVGFEDLSNFVRSFKRHVGRTPGEIARISKQG